MKSEVKVEKNENCTGYHCPDSILFVVLAGLDGN
jgi:hypothetical protein